MAEVGVSQLSRLLAALVRPRVASGALTESSLAALIGSSQAHVSNWLCGRKRLGNSFCESVMDELGVSVADVFGFSAAAPLAIAPARGVLVVMPGPHKARRSPWRRRVDPGRIAADFLGDGEAS